jgi:flavin-binding protein dodecin
MSVAKVTEISAQSSQSFEDAIRQGIERACRTLENVQTAWVNNMQVVVDGGKPSAYRVDMKVTFLLKD